MARARHRHRRVKAQPVSAEGAATTTTSHRRYFHFILLSTAVRSFEAGVVASMMPSIRQGLQLSYTSQGNVAGSPDYGIVPSGLLAMAIFKRFSPFVVLTSGYFIISAVSVCCALLPSLPTLVAARAIGGLCWGLAAVHYPTWVNRYGPAEQRTLWMAGINAMLLTGIVSGYVLGGLARATGAARWESLYLLEALLMFSCALLGSRFEPSVVQVEPAPASKAEKSDVTGERSFFSQRAGRLGTFRAFPFHLGCGLLPIRRCGLHVILHYSSVGSDLPLVTTHHLHLCELGDHSGSDRWHRPGSCLPQPCWRLSELPTGTSDERYMCDSQSPMRLLHAGGSPWIYGLANLGLLLFGAAPTAAINGIAVSCVPEAKHFASATQFAAQNLAKLLIPLVGGIVIDHLGLVRGYHVVTVGALLCYAVSSLIAFFQAKAREEMATAA